MTMQDGRYFPDTVEDVLQVLMDNARNVFGEDINDDEEAVIRTFYLPVARLIVNAQNDLKTVLDSAQLEYAEGRALDLLTALIGVRRKPAARSTGTVTFSRETAASVDYTIPRKTLVQTDSVTPIQFETEESVVLPAGSTTVSDVPVVALEPGIDSNVGANSLTVMTDPPTGVEDVTNPSHTTGGKEGESDDDLRERAKSELSDGMRGTARGVRNQVLKTPDVESVVLFINDSNTVDGDGLEGHTFEAVVEGGDDQEVGQTIFDSKGAGDGTQGGIRGTHVQVQADLGNGQTHPVEFSRPTAIKIYVDVTLTTNNEYGGDDEVLDSIIRYIGGTLTSGDTDDGEVRVGDDIVYSRLLYQIMDVNGVTDVTDLKFGTTSSPADTYVTIDDTEVASANATDGSITITKN